ncbi:MAG: cobyric acid synthase, partial [Niameybacter sp.]
GAGSPAEINLRAGDLVNMGMAELIDAPVILIGDIDKGGVFASLVGTIMLLSEEERKRVKGVIINKFRGDIEILKPGLKMLEDIIHIPVLGVVPYFKLDLEDEDSVSTVLDTRPTMTTEQLVIKIIRLPHLSNFTDFNRLFALEGVSVSYATHAYELEDTDLVILPGSKNTIDDLNFLKESGFAPVLNKLKALGKTIFGICGGYQMLGRHLYNPSLIESAVEQVEGLGLLPLDTQFETEKTMTQVKGKIISAQGPLKDCLNQPIEGYEIHMGQTIWKDACLIPFVVLHESLGIQDHRIEGYHDPDALVYGTYIHGIFDKLGFTLPFLNALALRKGLGENTIRLSGSMHTDYHAFKESQYSQLANVLRDSLDLEAIRHILFES